MVGTLNVAMPRPRKHNETETTRLAKALMREARFVANDLDMTVPDLLHEILVPEIHRRYLATIAKKAKEAEAERKRKPD